MAAKANITNCVGSQATLSERHSVLNRCCKLAEEHQRRRTSRERAALSFLLWGFEENLPW
jgi:hypothetical protein